ncbi:MAG: PilZ domain-containing protein [Thermodesulfobacteriota bacterium]
MKREFERSRLALKLSMSYRELHSPTYIDIIEITESSLSGISFISGKAEAEHKDVELRLRFPDGYLLRLIAQIVRCTPHNDGTYRLAAEFVTISEKNLGMLISALKN